MYDSTMEQERMTGQSKAFLPTMGFDGYATAINELSRADRIKLAEAAITDAPVAGILFDRAAGLNLVYRSTGRLRPVALMLLTDRG